MDTIYLNGNNANDNTNENTNDNTNENDNDSSDSLQEYTQELNVVVNNLALKYFNEPYMKSRLHTYIHNLSSIMKTDYEMYQKKQTRQTQLYNDKQTFIQLFLSKHLYYYLTSCEMFYEYDGIKYNIVSSDVVIHTILSTITSTCLHQTQQTQISQTLMEWKQSTKQSIIKQIKERSLFTSIPESVTIQNVISNIYPTVFETKNQAKYFLTIIGDNLFKKSVDLIYQVNKKIKMNINMLEDAATQLLGVKNIGCNFVTKYHEGSHPYENCRLMKMNKDVSQTIWVDILKKIGLDLLCVSAHYSVRYENADNFLDMKSDEDMKRYAYLLKNTTKEKVVDNFIHEYIEEIPTTTMEWKSIHFLLKSYLSTYSIPNVIYIQNVKNKLKEKYKYDEEKDVFIGVTSRHLPLAKSFLNFWDINICVIDNNKSSFKNEIELDEMVTLFKNWLRDKDTTIQTNPTILQKHSYKGSVVEKDIQRIIEHYKPQIEIIDNKYVINVTCSLWDKIEDIKSSYSFIKNELETNYSNEMVSIEELYDFYFKYKKVIRSLLVVSKYFFHSYMSSVAIPNDVIIYDKFIKVVDFSQLL
jgi:hypothetical protein